MVELQEWQTEHKRVIKEFLSFLGTNSNLVLKGGTALMLCYGLNRFSEDLDFDALFSRGSTINLVTSFCNQHNYECFVKKDTDTVQRVTIHYGDVHPLKIETSYRRQFIDNDEVVEKNGIKTYSLPVLASMKLAAYAGRDRIRDLYDITS